MLAAIASAAMVLRAALHRSWDACGALQLPLRFETACACVIAVTMAGPFGEAERATGRRLPWLRLATAAILTTVATAALIAAGIGPHLAGGGLTVARNLIGLTILDLLCAVALGGAWNRAPPAEDHAPSDGGHP